MPFWAKDISIGSRMINARAETVSSKPSFRNALKKRRCLIPADGFYEWKGKKGNKQPFYVFTPSSEPFAFAGLWYLSQDRLRAAAEYAHAFAGMVIGGCYYAKRSKNRRGRSPTPHNLPLHRKQRDFQG